MTKFCETCQIRINDKEHYETEDHKYKFLLQILNNASMSDDDDDCEDSDDDK